MEWRSDGVLELSAPTLQYSITLMLPSVNAKPLEPLALQAGPSRCESGHGGQLLSKCNQFLHAALRRRKFVVQIHVRAPFLRIVV
jgi:hypothetical protein